MGEEIKPTWQGSLLNPTVSLSESARALRESIVSVSRSAERILRFAGPQLPTRLTLTTAVTLRSVSFRQPAATVGSALSRSSQSVRRLKQDLLFGFHGVLRRVCGLTKRACLHSCQHALVFDDSLLAITRTPLLKR
jgi:hypothetical protein